MATAIQTNGKITRVIGEGNEDDDEFLEVLDIMHAMHESLREAKKRGKTVQVEISIVPIV